MKKTKIASILLLSAAFVVSSCTTERATSSSKTTSSSPATTTSIADSSSKEEISTIDISSGEGTSQQSQQSGDDSQLTSEGQSSEQSQQSDQSQQTEQSQTTSQETTTSLPAVDPVIVAKKGDQILVSKEQLAPNDLAAYVVDLEIGDVVTITADGNALKFTEAGQQKSESDPTQFVATREGQHTFYVNKDLEVWYVQPDEPAPVDPVIVAKKGENVLVSEENPGADNYAKYVVDLEIGDVVTITVDGNALKFTEAGKAKSDEDPTSFVAARAGQHTFYVNKSLEVWYVQPEEPAPVNPVISAKLGEETLVEEENPGEDNWAKYIVEFDGEADKTLVITADNEPLVFAKAGDEWNPEGEKSLTLSEAGTYTFYVNKLNQVWWSFVAKPAVDPVIVAKKGENVLVSEENPGADNYAMFVADLEIGDVIVITADGNALKFTEADHQKSEEDPTQFVATREGQHTFYVNKSLEVWYVQPEEPAPVDPVIVAKKGEDVLTPSENPGAENYAMYVADLEIGDVITITADGNALKFTEADHQKSDEDPTSFVATRAGQHSFYVNKSLEVWYVQPEEPAPVDPVIVAKKGENVLTPSENPGADNYAKYVVDLEIGDVITITADGNALKFTEADHQKSESNPSQFVATRAGQHTFYVNKSLEVWYVQPEEPVLEYSAKVNGETSDKIEEVEPDNPADKAQYVANLEVNDQVVIYYGEEALKIGDTEATIYTAEEAGEYVIYVNSENKVFIDKKQAEPQEDVLVAKVGETPIEAEQDPGDDKAVYVVEHEGEDQIVTITLNGNALTFCKAGQEWDAEGPKSLTMSEDGTYTFYVNNQNQAWWTFQAKQEEQKEYSAKINGESSDKIRAVTPTSETDNAQFVANLVVGNKVTIYYGDDALLIADTESSIFTAEVEGIYVFYVNSENKVYVQKQEPQPQQDVFAALVDGVGIYAEQNPGEGNKVKYVYEHEGKSQVINIILNGDDLVFAQAGSEWDPKGPKSLTMDQDGTYTFYVNDQNQVWWTFKAKPVDQTIVAKVGETPIEPELDPGEGNKAKYVVEHEGEDETVVITIGGNPVRFTQAGQEKSDEDPTSLTLTQAGTYTFYVNNDNEVWWTFKAKPVDQTIVAKVGETPIEPELDPEEGNRAKYVVEHEGEDETVVITIGGNPVRFTKAGQERSDEDPTSLALTQDGTYTFYVNDENQVWWMFQAKPVDQTIVAKVGETPIEAEQDPGEGNKAKYVVEHEGEDETVTITLNGNALTFCRAEQEWNPEGPKSLTMTEAGTYTFYVNDENQVWWVFAPKPVDQTIVAKVGETPLEAEQDPGDDKAVYVVEHEGEDETVTITLNGNALTFCKAGQDWNPEGPKSLTMTEDGTYAFYVNEQNQVWWTFQAKQEEQPQQQMFTLTITIDVSWWNTDGALTYVHYWGQGIQGSTWYGIPATYNEVTGKYTVELPVGTEHIVVVRVSSDGMKPWNKTVDLDITGSTITFNSDNVVSA